MRREGYHYLTLSGTSPLVLLQFLHDHPEVDHLSLRPNNDKAERDDMEKIGAAIREDRALQGQALTVE